MRNLYTKNVLHLVPIQFDEHVYIALSKEDGDTEEILARKLLVYNRIVTLLYGPVVTRYAHEFHGECV